MSASAGSGPCRIIYIDDDQGFAMLAKCQLERIGNLVTVFEIPGAALDALGLASKTWDMVITDLRVLGPNGIEVARSIRDRHPELSHGLICADPDSRMAREVAAAGLAPILPRPTSLAEFDTLVSRVDAQCRFASIDNAVLHESERAALLEEWRADRWCSQPHQKQAVGFAMNKSI